MKLTLIMPSIGRKPGEEYIATWQMEPLVLALLAALTPSEWDVTIQDDRMEPIDYSKPADLVGITVETYTARRAYQIADNFRSRGVPVVMGGYHPTLFPDEALHFADSVVQGSAEGVWPELLADFRRGTLRKSYSGPRQAPTPGLFPRREVYSGRGYLPLALVEFSRGCRFHCSFCSITSFYRGNHAFRPPEDVAEEIRKSGQKNVFLIDDNLAADIPAAFALCRVIKPLGVKWVSQISVDAACDSGLVREMAEAGCMGVLIGFESLRPDLIARFNKRCNGSIEAYERALANIRQNRICVYATFLFGADGDDLSSFPHTLEFILRHRFFLAAFNHLVPFPGTPLYARLETEGRMRFDRWWLDPEFRFGEVPFRTIGMEAKEVAESCRRYRKKFYSLRSIVRRGLDFQTNAQSLPIAALFLSQNLFGKREVDQKFGLPLGFGNEGNPRIPAPEAG